MNTIRIYRMVILAILIVLPSTASSQESYKFERMWPALQQSWNFLTPNGTAFDTHGNFYVADSKAHRIVKLNQDGFYMTDWGREGSADGEFSMPLGVAVDNEGNVYVTEQGNHRVQKFDSNGAFMTKWGQLGAGENDLNIPAGIAADGLGNVYVADTENNRIQKYSSNGAYLLTIEGDLNKPYDVTVDSSNYVYVADTDNWRILKYTPGGFFVGTVGETPSCPGLFSYPIDIDSDPAGNIYIAGKDNSIWKLDAEENCVGLWGGYGIEEGQFYELNSIAIDKNGYVYAADKISIQKFTSDGDFIIRWSNFGSDAGEFNQPSGVAIDTEGYSYVVDIENYRIQKFSPDGGYERMWGEFGAGNEQFGGLWGIATDGANNVFVADPGNSCIKKFSPEGNFLVKWGSYGTGEGEFEYPAAVAVDSAGNVFVTDVWSDTRCIQKFTPTPDGTGGINGSGYEFAASWGTYSHQPDPLPGEFMNPSGIAVDGEGNAYVTDRDHSRIQKFKPTPDGTGGIDNSGYEIDVIFGGMGTGPGEFLSPYGIALDNEANVYVTDSISPRIQKFDPEGNFIVAWGGTGLWTGQFEQPEGIAVSPDGKVYVTDRGNNHVQVFKKYEAFTRPRAIIVAGQASATDSLWDATQVCTNFAYRALSYQGYTKDEIYYLTADTDIDLDGNKVFDEVTGYSDDVDASPTWAHLRSAIIEWAVDEHVDSLLLYLNDHGGPDTFRLHEGADGVLSSTDLASWLDTLQASTSAKVTVVYEACESGSFIDNLQGNNRIIITSTLPGEQAKFLSLGTISFSYFFWTHIFNGQSIGESYDKATEMVNFSFSNQNPQLSGDAEHVNIGNGAAGMISDAPAIGYVSADPPEIAGEETTATLFAEGVSDPDGIARVWAVLWPPDFDPGPAGNPLLSLPTCELLYDTIDDRYEGTYSEFTADGTYQVSIYAMDKENNITLPQLTTVSRNYRVTRRAVIIAGGSSADVTRSIIEINAETAYNALIKQLYTPSDIYFMSVTGIPGSDDYPYNASLGNYLNNLAVNEGTENLDLVIYLIGSGNAGNFTMNGKSPPDVLSASQLYGWLGALQAAKPGRLKIIYDGDKSGSFITNVPPPPGSERIVITSSTEDGAAYFSGAGEICFSTFFWSQVASGATVYNAYAHAKKAISYLSRKEQIAFTCSDEQTPQLEASGNGEPNEEADYRIARARTIGIGLKTAADPPQIGSASVEANGDTITITAEGITSTFPVERVWAVIEPIGYCPGFSGSGVPEIPEIELDPVGDGSYEGTTTDPASAFKVVVYAVDEDGSTSSPKESRIYQPEGGDIYERDDTRRRSNVIVIDHPVGQPHNFHHASDEDWVRFYGVSGEYYTIAAGNLGTDCVPVIELYYPGETTPEVEDTILNEMVSIDFECLASGFYYVRLLNSTDGENTDYELRVYHPYWPDALTLIAGRVQESSSRDEIDGAVITTNPGGGLAVSVAGEYEFMQKPGVWRMDAVKSGYSFDGVDLTVESGVEFMQRDILMNSIRAACNQDNDCDDGLFCNGIEVCVDGDCKDGNLPCSDDGLFCTGEETCDDGQDRCVSTGNPCQGITRCDEAIDACVYCTRDADCDDGEFCNGVETCVETICQPGTDPCPEGVTCNEESDACNTPYLTVTPQTIMQFRWMPLPLFLRITGSNTHFDGTSEVTFRPASVVALPFVWRNETITCIGLMMPSFLTEPNNGTIEVSITTGIEQVSGTVDVNSFFLESDGGKSQGVMELGVLKRRLRIAEEQVQILDF